MKKTTLTQKLTLAVSLVSALTILVSGLVFSFFYYVLSEKDLQNYIVDQSRSITSQQIVYHQGQIMYRENEKGETLSARLRTLDLSAVIFDIQFKPLGSYGIYNTIPRDAFEETVSIDTLQQVAADQKSRLGRLATIDNRLYNTYTLPLISSGQIVGVIQFAKETQVISKIVSLDITLLVLILPLGVLLNSFVVSLLLRNSLLPLSQLISHLKKTPPGESPQKVPLKGLTHDEISDLVNTFNQLLDQVGESIEKQKDFIAHASHELKTPITAAVSSLDLAVTDLSSKSSSLKHILRVKQNLLSLNHTIDSLLTMSRLSKKTSSPKISPYLLKPVLNSMILLHKEPMNKKDINLTLDCPEFLTSNIPVEHIQIIISNILDNAIKFSHNKGQIFISCTDSQQNTKLEISDNGPGIPEQDLVKIFDRFYRSRSSSKTPGSGLGLALVKLICDLHRIPVSVVSHKNIGTTFTLLIPKI
jgi:signal transduction histidine kinase